MITNCDNIEKDQIKNSLYLCVRSVRHMTEQLVTIVSSINEKAMEYSSNPPCNIINYQLSPDHNNFTATSSSQSCQPYSITTTPPPTTTTQTSYDTSSMSICTQNGFQNTCMDTGFQKTHMNNGCQIKCMDNGRKETCMDNGFIKTCMNIGRQETCTDNGFIKTCMDNGCQVKCMDNGFIKTCMDNGYQIKCIDNGREITCIDNGRQIPCMDNGHQIPCMDNGRQITCIDNSRQIPCMDNGRQITCIDNGCQETCVDNCCQETCLDNCIEEPQPCVKSYKNCLIIENVMDTIPKNPSTNNLPQIIQPPDEQVKTNSSVQTERESTIIQRDQEVNTDPFKIYLSNPSGLTNDMARASTITKQYSRNTGADIPNKIFSYLPYDSAENESKHSDIYDVNRKSVSYEQQPEQIIQRESIRKPQQMPRQSQKSRKSTRKNSQEISQHYESSSSDERKSLRSPIEQSRTSQIKHQLLKPSELKKHNSRQSLKMASTELQRKPSSTSQFPPDIQEQLVRLSQQFSPQVKPRNSKLSKNNSPDNQYKKHMKRNSVEQITQKKQSKNYDSSTDNSKGKSRKSIKEINPGVLPRISLRKASNISQDLRSIPDVEALMQSTLQSKQDELNTLSSSKKSIKSQKESSNRLRSVSLNAPLSVNIPNNDSSSDHLDIDHNLQRITEYLKQDSLLKHNLLLQIKTIKENKLNNSNNEYETEINLGDIYLNSFKDITTSDSDNYINIKNQKNYGNKNLTSQTLSNSDIIDTMSVMNEQINISDNKFELLDLDSEITTLNSKYNIKSDNNHSDSSTSSISAYTTTMSIISNKLDDNELSSQHYNQNTTISSATYPSKTSLRNNKSNSCVKNVTISNVSQYQSDYPYLIDIFSNQNNTDARTPIDIVSEFEITVRTNNHNNLNENYKIVDTNESNNTKYNTDLQSTMEVFELYPIASSSNEYDNFKDSCDYEYNNKNLYIDTSLYNCVNNHNSKITISAESSNTFFNETSTSIYGKSFLSDDTDKKSFIESNDNEYKMDIDVFKQNDLDDIVSCFSQPAVKFKNIKSHSNIFFNKYKNTSKIDSIITSKDCDIFVGDINIDEVDISMKQITNSIQIKKSKKSSGIKKSNNEPIKCFAQTLMSYEDYICGSNKNLRNLEKFKRTK